MAASYEVVVYPGLAITETFDAAGAPAAQAPVILHNGYSEERVYSNTSTPPTVAKVALSAALTAGSYVLDLTAAPKNDGGTQDLTGKKLLAVQFGVRAGGAAMTIGPDPTNGYAPFGAGTSPSFPAGALMAADLVGVATPAVAAGAKRIKITGTGTDQFDLLLAFRDP